MRNTLLNKNLRYQYEVLRARFEIREFFLAHFSRNVYENVGQVLSLVRIRLALYGSQEKEGWSDNISVSRSLIAQSIQDLRSMCRSLDPDTLLYDQAGWIDALKSITEVLYPGYKDCFHVSGEQKEMSPAAGMIIFGIIQEILVSIKNQEHGLKDLTICYSAETASVKVRYIGLPVNWGNKENCSKEGARLSRINVYERAKLIKGNLSVKVTRAGMCIIVLKMPLNSSLYDY